MVSYPKIDIGATHTLHVVVGVVLNAKRQALVALRPPHVDQGGLWEFPGGKIEPGETGLQALRRELQEETDLSNITAEPLMNVTHQYKKYRVTLYAWLVARFHGKPIGLLGQSLKWVAITELPQLNFPAANRAIINKLLTL